MLARNHRQAKEGRRLLKKFKFWQGIKDTLRSGPDRIAMGKKGKRGDKPSEKKALMKRLDALAKKLEEELKGADLFAPLPPKEDCPICLVRLPRVIRGYYKGCCGKRMCSGCFKENARVIEANAKEAGESFSLASLACPFCRAPGPTPSQYLDQLKLRASQHDGEACNTLGASYSVGKNGAQMDHIASLHYYILAAELGSAEACGGIASTLEAGKVVPVDKVKAGLFYKIGALRGHICSRLLIAVAEYELGSHEVGIRHFKIAAEAGMQPALDMLKKIFNANGKLPGKEFISEEELDTLYRMCHEAQEEVKSEEREKHLLKEDKLSTWRKL